MRSPRCYTVSPTFFPMKSRRPQQSSLVDKQAPVISPRRRQVEVLANGEQKTIPVSPTEPQ